MGWGTVGMDGRGHRLTWKQSNLLASGSQGKPPEQAGQEMGHDPSSMREAMMEQGRKRPSFQPHGSQRDCLVYLWEKWALPSPKPTIPPPILPPSSNLLSPKHGPSPTPGTKRRLLFVPQKKGPVTICTGPFLQVLLRYLSFSYGS